MNNKLPLSERTVENISYLQDKEMVHARTGLIMYVINASTFYKCEYDYNDSLQHNGTTIVEVPYTNYRFVGIAGKYNHYSSGGGSGTNKIFIPKLQLRVNGHPDNFMLQCRYNADNLEFMNYNPVIRLFRYSHAKDYSHWDQNKQYYNRTANSKYRFAKNSIFVNEVVCPNQPDTFIDLPFDYALYSSIAPDQSEGSLTRKNRGKLKLYYTAPPFTNISIPLAAAIVIEVDGKKIWNEISEFRLMLINMTFEGTSTIKRMISIR